MDVSSETATVKSLSRRPNRRSRGWLVAGVAVLALLMGAPTIRGGFVGGDDHRLVLNHVLVNHPSFSHAFELFRIVHRDLYQPLPLLSFQIEFAIANAIGLFQESVHDGEWLFHLTNILLHAVNAVLVWFFLMRFGRDENRQANRWVATVAAILFAIHPLQVEVVAWVNGRMMLMSTLFATASLITFDRWLQEGRRGSAVWTVLCVVLCAISKIRVGLPVLLLIVAFLRRKHRHRPVLILWGICTILTGIFVAINWSATADAGMFAGARAQLHGSRIVRTLLALAWYFRHMVWPTGLASWYPTPTNASWSDPDTVYAVIVVAITVTLAWWTIRLRRVCAFGWLWFFSTIASTLPLMPARNSLAADRYMYLPIVGLVWVGGVVVAVLIERLRRRSAERAAVWCAVALFVAVTPLSIGMSWQTASFYRNAVTKARRIADLHPSVPHVWERAAGAYLSAGDCDTAIKLAQRELVQENVAARSMALRVIGQAQFERGERELGLASLRKAVEVDPKNPKAKYTLGKTLADMGRMDEAISWIEASIAADPLANPRLIRLASIYRLVGRLTDARRAYEDALANNAYEVPAIMGLAELAVAEGNPDSLEDARRRLADMLSWMPENADAWATLGVIEKALGHDAAALSAYKEALKRDPKHGTAALNLALIHQQKQEMKQAADYLAIALEDERLTLENPLALHDALIVQGAIDRARRLWHNYLRVHPDSEEGRLFAAWTDALTGGREGPADALRYVSRTAPAPLAVATLAYAALTGAQGEQAFSYVERLCQLGTGVHDAFRRLLGALERFDQHYPGGPWVYCLTARILSAEGLAKEAKLAIGLCESRCRDDACKRTVTALRSLRTGSHN